MILTLKRTNLHADYTEGHLYIDGLFFCDTIEDRYRDFTKEVKVPGKTAIPYGVYPVRLSMSNRFKKVLPEVQNVPQFSGIRIHSGNTAADSEGCILVGEHTGPGRIGLSRDTMARLLDVMGHAINKKGETVELEVI